MPTVLSQLDPLLNAWRALAEDDPTMLSMEPDPDRDELSVEVRERIQGKGAVTEALAWWAEREGDLDERGRVVHLQAVLHALDIHFGGQPLQPVDGEGERIRLVGQRWWGAVASRPRRPFTIQEPFPHLARGVLHREEWVEERAATEAFGSALLDGALRVGLCALPGSGPTAFEATEVVDLDTLGFRGTSVDDPSGECAPLREAVAWAVERGVHVLAFPELAVDEAGRTALRDAIKSTPGSLCLVVAGSFHVASERDANAVANGSPVWAVVEGVAVPVCTVEKTEPITTGPAGLGGDIQQRAEAESCTAVREHIQPGGRVRVVPTPVGAFSVLICKDALVLGADGPFGDIRTKAYRSADHVVIPSMNGSAAAWFWGQAEESGRHHETATYYVNAAWVADDGVDVAFWSLPYRVGGLTTEPEDAGGHARFPSGHEGRDEAETSRVSAPPDSGRVLVEVPLPTLDWFSGGAR